MKKLLFFLSLAILTVFMSRCAHAQNECPSGTYVPSWGTFTTSDGITHQTVCIDINGRWVLPLFLQFSGGPVMSTYVGNNGTFTAGPVTNTLSAGFINSMTQTHQFSHGFADEANVSPAPANGGYASFSAAPAFTLSTNTNHYNGFQFFPTINSSAVLTSLVGFISTPTLNNTSAILSVVDHYADEINGSGPLMLHEGLFIAPFTKASVNLGFVVETPSQIGYSGATANQLIIESEAAPATGNAPAQLVVTGATNTNEQLRLGFDTTSLLGVIQCEIAGTSFNPCALQPNGGGVLIGTKTDCGKVLCVAGQIQSTQATGTTPLVIASTTPVTNLTTSPTSYDHTGSQIVNYHLVEDSCVLGTSCAVILAGAAVYTSSTSYTCTCQDNTAITSCKVSQTSGSAFTITGTGTDTIRYHCGGN